MSERIWKIWIDTGGTFTDCMAIDPAGRLYRQKVLSKGALRGKIKGLTAPDTIEYQSGWGIAKDIFKGYVLKTMEENPIIARVISCDLANNLLTLDQHLDEDHLGDLDFELSAGEAAPILATRLITLTGLNEEFPPLEMRLGSTIGTNALLERKGARTTLVVTKGFKDLLRIGNQQRPDIFSLNIEKPGPLYSEVLELDERLEADGSIRKPLSDASLIKLAGELEKLDPESIAVSLLHSYRNQDHEKKIGRYLQKKGFTQVDLSSEIVPLIHYLNRTETTLVNAYLSPGIKKYLKQVHDSIGERSLRIMTSAGGMVKHNHFLPRESLFSGPAGGVVGAASMGRKAGIKHLLSFDMGGTSTDVSRYDGYYDYQYETQVGGITIVSPSLTIETVASGGGSVCTYDGMKFSVGPESAGSSPGPACYGEGGPLTITDVNLLLGRLDEDHFGIPISLEKSKKAFNQLFSGHQGKISCRDAILEGFLQIVNEKMANAIRKISVNKGYDPSDYALVSFGGAGGQHALDIAEMLNMTTVLIPFDASLLSALGMGHARIERFAVKQVLIPIKETLDHLEEMIETCGKQAMKALMEEGLHEEEITLREVLLYLRFRGQETTLEIKYRKDKVIHDFREMYMRLYGHWIEDREIELESIKVIAAEQAREPDPSIGDLQEHVPEASGRQSTFLESRWQQVPFYNWEKLDPGATFEGPCLLKSRFTSVIIRKNWSVILDHELQAHCRKQGADDPEMMEDGTREGMTAIDLELFTNRFSALAEEMGALLRRTSFSVNIKERLDFSCALLDHEGQLIVNAPHIPVHLGGLGLCVRQIKDLYALNPGDVLITNHPAYGGSHLPDITLVAPVFDSRDRLVGFVANRAHHAELGGKRPGSMPPDARHLAEEGVVIDPIHLVRAGRAAWDKISNILSVDPFPSRNIHENLADLNGALASIQSGVKSLQKLCDLYGTDRTMFYMKALKTYARERLLDSLKKLRKHHYQAEEKLDDGTMILVNIRIDQNGIIFDLNGSSSMHPGNLNATPAIVRSAIIYVLRLLIKEPIPLNEGIMEPVRIFLPSGFLNPDFDQDPKRCPAVVGGNTETSQRLVDTLLKALSLSACSQGTMNNFVFGDSTFSYYETICGGTGATKGHHGADAVHQHMTNTRITDPEILEFRYPVLLDLFAIRQGSGGKGKWHGGDGVIRRIIFNKPLEVTLLTQHREYGPYGMKGGSEGARGEQYLIRSGKEKRRLSGMAAFPVEPGDSVEIRTPGGGGWGK